MQTEANVVRAYRQLPNGFRSCEAVRLKLADEGQDISAEKIRDVIRVMAAIECKTDNIVRAANTLRRVLELGELSEVAPAARHMQDAEDILFALKPLPTEWAFRELRQALALVFAAAEHLRECNRQLDHADKIDALREQRKEHDAVKTTQEPSPSAKEYECRLQAGLARRAFVRSANGHSKRSPAGATQKHSPPRAGGIHRRRSPAVRLAWSRRRSKHVRLHQVPRQSGRAVSSAAHISRG